MFFRQNWTTNIVIGPIVTSANVFTSAATTAMNLAVSKNGSSDVVYSCSTIVMQSSVTCRFRVPLSSAAVDTLGKISIAAYQTVAVKANTIIEGDVISSEMYDRLFGTTAFALPSDVWGYSTRTLTSFASSWASIGTTVTLDQITSGVWNYTSRDLSTYSGLSAAVWGYSTRNLTSLGVTLAADVWAVTTRAVTAIPAGYSTMVPSDVWTSPTTRTLTSWGGASTASAVQISSAVWQETTRTLTSYGGASTASVAQISTAVWAEASRTLTSWGGASTASAAQISSAVWAETTRSITTGTVGTVNNISSSGIDSIWDEAVEGTLTARQAMRIQTDVLGANSTGGGTTQYTITKWDSTAARIIYTLTSVGNRSVSTYDLT